MARVRAYSRAFNRCNPAHSTVNIPPAEDACIAGHAQSAVRGDSSQPGLYVIPGVDLEAEPFVREEQKELKPETIEFRRKNAP
jgi:hypothetical protein